MESAAAVGWPSQQRASLGVHADAHFAQLRKAEGRTEVLTQSASRWSRQETPETATPGWSRPGSSEDEEEGSASHADSGSPEGELAEEPSDLERPGGCGNVRINQCGIGSTASSSSSKKGPEPEASASLGSTCPRTYTRSFLLQVLGKCQGAGLLPRAPPSGPWFLQLEARPAGRRPHLTRAASLGAQQAPGQQPTWTTLLVQNIPKQCTRALLTEQLDVNGYEGEYDLVYMPICPSTSCHMGYAFVNFCNVVSSFRFAFRFHGVPAEELFPGSGTDVVLGVYHAALQSRLADSNFGDPRCEDSQPFAADRPSSRVHAQFPGVQQPQYAFSAESLQLPFCSSSEAEQVLWSGSCRLGSPDFNPFEGIDSVIAPVASKPSRSTPPSTYERLQEFFVGGASTPEDWCTSGKLGSPLPAAARAFPRSDRHRMSDEVMSKDCTTSASTSRSSASSSEASSGSQEDGFSEGEGSLCSEPGPPADSDAGSSKERVGLPQLQPQSSIGTKEVDACGDPLAGETHVCESDEAAVSESHEAVACAPQLGACEGGHPFEGAPPVQNERVEAGGARERRPPRGLSWLPRLVLIFAGFTLGYLLPPLPQHVSVAKSVDTPSSRARDVATPGSRARGRGGRSEL